MTLRKKMAPLKTFWTRRGRQDKRTLQDGWAGSWRGDGAWVEAGSPPEGKPIERGRGPGGERLAPGTAFVFYGGVRFLLCFVLVLETWENICSLYFFLS